MSQKSDRGRVAISIIVYAAAALGLVCMRPENPLVVAIHRVLMFAFVVLYACGGALLFEKVHSKRFLGSCSFTSKTNRMLYASSMGLCGVVIVYASMCLLPLAVFHRPTWTKYVEFQCGVIEAVEGSKSAQRFWNRCYKRLGQIAVNAETDGDLQKAYRCYKQYNEMSDRSHFPHVVCNGALGRLLDKVGHYEAANVAYAKSEGTADETSNDAFFVSHGRLLRMLTFVPEKIAVREFPFMETVIMQKDDSALSIGESYQNIDFSKLTDYQRMLMHCVFHPEDSKLRVLPKAPPVVSFIDTQPLKITPRCRRKGVLYITVNAKGNAEKAAGVQ